MFDFGAQSITVLPLLEHLEAGVLYNSTNFCPFSLFLLWNLVSISASKPVNGLKG